MAAYNHRPLCLRALYDGFYDASTPMGLIDRDGDTAMAYLGWNWCLYRHPTYSFEKDIFDMYCRLIDEYNGRGHIFRRCKKT